MPQIYLLISCLLAAFAAQGQESFSVYTQLHSLNYSEASAVYQMAKEKWRDFPKSDGKHAFSRNRLVLGMQEGALSLEFIRRFDYQFSFSPDAAKLFYYMGGRREIPLGQEFQAKLKINHLDAYGVRFGIKSQRWHGLQAKAWLSALRGVGLQQGEINGTFSQTGKGEYQAFAPLDYHYSRDLLLEHDANGLGSPKGLGGALDLALDWQGENSAVQLLVEDAYSYMHWKDAGVLQGVVDLSFAETDGKRETAFKQGMRGREAVTQEHLPAFVQLSSHYQWQAWQARAGVIYYDDLLFPRLGGGYQWQSQYLRHQLITEYEFNSEKLRLSYQASKLSSLPSSNIQFTLGSNDRRLTRAHALEFGIAAAVWW